MIYGFVVYDISNTKFRSKVANIMKNYGERIQYSVFKFELLESNYESMLEDISNLYREYYRYIKNKNSKKEMKKSIIIIRQCRNCKEKNVVFIRSDMGEIEESFII